MDAGYLPLVRVPFGLGRQVLVYPTYPTEEWAQIKGRTHLAD